MKEVINREALLKARVHLGHICEKWHPDFAPYIFSKKNGMHIINVDKTLVNLRLAGQKMRTILEEGKKILLVGRKKQAKEIIEKLGLALNQPYVTVRWLGGTLTNFTTIRKLLKKVASFKDQEQSEEYRHLPKREKLIKERKRKKDELLLGGLMSINRLPAAIFVVDVNRELTAIKEARKVGIPIFGLIDSNASPKWVDYPIPANDDAISSIEINLRYLESKMAEGVVAWEKDKAKQEERGHGVGQDYPKGKKSFSHDQNTSKSLMRTKKP